MNVFVGDDPQRSVLVMRMVNAIVFVALLSVALTVLAPAIRSAVASPLPLSWFLGLFIIPSTNPSSWTVTGVIFLWAFGLPWPSERRGGRNGRGCWRSPPASRYFWRSVHVSMPRHSWRRGDRGVRAHRVDSTSVLISFVVLLVLATIGLISSPRSAPREAASLGRCRARSGTVLTNIVYLPVYVIGSVGGMPLGWNDTVLPPLVPVFGVLVLGALMARGLQDAPRSKGIALLVSLGAVAAVPLVFLQREGLGVGEVVQARYLLPLILVLMLTLSLRVPFWRTTDGGLPLPGVLAWVIGVGVAVAASVSLWVHAHRYAAGNERGLFDIDLVLEWTGLLSIPLPVTVGVGVVASVTFVAAALIGVRRDAVTTERTDSRTTAFRLVR